MYIKNYKQFTGAQIKLHSYLHTQVWYDNYADIASEKESNIKEQNVSLVHNRPTQLKLDYH